MDWEPFRDAVEDAISDATPEDSLTNRITHFNNILIKAAKVHVGKCKRGPRSNDWMTPPSVES